MHRIARVSLLFVCLSISLQAQRVGLVLSGGGAKGIAHIAVIQALEENGIPIDYITGTSMGAIVGGLYASGYSPADMINILESEDFKHWSTGTIPKKYFYFYKERYSSPAMINLRFLRQDSLTVFKPPTSLVSPFPMDLGLMELFAQSGGHSNNNFDSLFVPYRCVAADIYKGEAVVMRNGELPSAIRASMTYPFYFKPIEIDSVLLFDGGIYNNFPWDLMVKDFNPDIIIGVKVTSGRQKPTEDNVLLQLENMVTGLTDYNLPEEKGILIEINTENVSVMDFHKYQEIYENAQKEVSSYLEQIKTRIQRRVPFDTLQAKRVVYRSRLPDLLFNHIVLQGIDQTQILYVIKSIRPSGELFGIEQLRQQYYRLVTDDKISSIYPRAIYNKNSGHFDLFLEVQSKSIFETYIGGNISSGAINQGFAAFDYKQLGEQSYNFEGNLYFGRLYSSVLLRTRMELPGLVPFFFDFSGSLSRLDFFSSSNDLFFEDVRPPYLIQNERQLRIDAGFPVSVNRFLKVGIAAGTSTNKYYQVQQFKKEDIPDVTAINQVVFSIGSERNTTNYLQYPTRGIRYRFKGSYIMSIENYNPGTTAPIANSLRKGHRWVEVGAEYQRYFPVVPKFYIGAHLEGFWSNRNFLSNYTSTLLDARYFGPTPHSQTLFLENYRANQFIAAGIKPVWQFNDLLHLRNEIYVFAPVRPLLREQENNKPYHGSSFSKFRFMWSTSLVAQTLFGPVSVSVNYYDRDEKRFYFLLNFGYIMFNEKIRN